MDQIFSTRVRSTRTYTEIRRQGYVEKDEDEALVESDDELVLTLLSISLHVHFL